LKTIFTFFDLFTLILFFLSLIGLLLFEVSIFDQAFYFVGFFWFLLMSVRTKNVKKRFSLLHVLFLLNDWFSSKLDYKEEKGPSSFIQWAFPVSVGLLMISFSREKGSFYFFGLLLGGVVNYFQSQLFTKKI
jgi:hypothetical protein